ncbi:serine protease [Paracoccus sp. MC1862]|uniref:S1 family peptidase n=1 Tax=Paracoccus sp. MC1862 TaxID=2760307 RepID=UPI001604460A|nr:serine protease [Paracoccus sp. MC1862]MBB1497722.1 trypsin-like peptidase domain-containing protein [Paracoccus sp. MC1862]QQO45213.1 trypsin-like peptidase domain-containing protein [Paracoccus sp. MC1862]
MTSGYYREASAVRFARYRVCYPSLVARPLALLARGQIISRATGFIYENAGSMHLVSNWHVFSGRDIYTGAAKHSSLAIPDEVEVQFPAKLISDEREIELHTGNFPLQSSSEKPLWKMHPKGHEVDVAVLPININNPNDKTAIAPVNISLPVNMSNGLRVANDVFIVGFPEKFPIEMALPIWKRGTIAAEPLLDGEYARKFFIDAATRPGMSGSPVFYRRNKVIMLDDGTQASSLLEAEFVPCGIYSGRIDTSDQFAATIGIVWLLGFIEEIVANGVAGGFVRN